MTGNAQTGPLINSTETDKTETELKGEIYDDAQFYSRQLKDFVSSNSNSLQTMDNKGPEDSSYIKKRQKLQKMLNKPKAPRDSRMSKDRRIKYIVHDKIMGFMPTYTEEEQEALWESRLDIMGNLFGQSTDNGKKVSTKKEVLDVKII